MNNIAATCLQMPLAPVAFVHSPSYVVDLYTEILPVRSTIPFTSRLDILFVDISMLITQQLCVLISRAQDVQIFFPPQNHWTNQEVI